MKRKRTPPFPPILFVSLCVYKRWIIADASFPSNAWEWLLIIAAIAELLWIIWYVYNEKKPVKVDLVAVIHYDTYKVINRLQINAAFGGGGGQMISFSEGFIFFQRDSDIMAYKHRFPNAVILDHFHRVFDHDFSDIYQLKLTGIIGFVLISNEGRKIFSDEFRYKRRFEKVYNKRLSENPSKI